VLPAVLQQYGGCYCHLPDNAIITPTWATHVVPSNIRTSNTYTVGEATMGTSSGTYVLDPKKVAKFLDKSAGDDDEEAADAEEGVGELTKLTGFSKAEVLEIFTAASEAGITPQQLTEALTDSETKPTVQNVLDKIASMAEDTKSAATDAAAATGDGDAPPTQEELDARPTQEELDALMEAASKQFSEEDMVKIMVAATEARLTESQMFQGLTEAVEDELSAEDVVAKIEAAGDDGADGGGDEEPATAEATNGDTSE